MQNPIKVAIQGEKASFHEIAAHQYYTAPIELLYCQSFEEVFEQSLNKTVDRAFVAVANSSHGKITNVHALMGANNLVIEGEHLLPIHQHLIGTPGSQLKDIKTILSHPIALSQCHIFIKNQFGEALVRDYYDTSAAVHYIQQRNDSSIAAIGSEAAARLYGLKILRRSIQNDPNNATLFTSLMLPDEPKEQAR